MDLEGWATRLEKHFGEIAGSRKADGWPVFALEHGLSSGELEELRSRIWDHLRLRDPSVRHWLAWVAFAAEEGYRYVGDDYWPAIEDQRSMWAPNRHRTWLRECFHRFRDKFGGAQPSGAWAEQFSIICWPIKHAILPKDLQRQLAWVLDEASVSFSTEMLSSVTTLGQRIHLLSIRLRASSRFQNFAEDHALAGQIAAALLLRGNQFASGLLLPATLDRLIRDLEAQQESREWLRRAQRSAERVQLRGLAPGATVSRPDPTRTRTGAIPVVDSEARPSLEPALLLRPSAERWTVLLEIPEMASIATLSPEIEATLTRSRCSVAGSSERIARGRLLDGTQSVRLERLPAADERLLTFENEPPLLAARLNVECRLRHPGSWLFRVGVDGIGREVVIRAVRPGRRYVYLSREAVRRPPATERFARVAAVDCEGVHGIVLEIPAEVTATALDYFKHLGLGLAPTVRVWPVGLPPSYWDGEGRVEWTASDDPVIAVASDQPVERVALVLDGSHPLRLPPLSPGRPVFVGLDSLAPGLHVLGVSVYARTGIAEATGQLAIGMREAASSRGGFGSTGPIVLSIDPARPALEEMWEGRASLDLRGPPGRTLVNSIAFLVRGEPERVLPLPQLPLPVTPDAWRSHFDKHVRQSELGQQSYDMAHACRIVFDTGELGVHAIECERRLQPLRWAPLRQDGYYVLRLFDDSGPSSRLKVNRFSFSSPDRPQEIVVGDAQTIKPSREGGLYVAETERHRAAVILPPKKEMSISSSGDQLIDEESSVETLVGLMRLWATARVTGALRSVLRQFSVLRELEGDLIEVLCGDRWRRIEHARERSQSPADGLTPLRAAIASRGPLIGFGNELHQGHRQWGRLPTRERVAMFAGVSRRFFPRLPAQAAALGLKPASQDVLAWAAEFALRITSAPESLSPWVGSNLSAAARLLRDFPEFARGARLVVLAVDGAHGPKPAFIPLHGGWDWV